MLADNHEAALLKERVALTTAAERFEIHARYVGSLTNHFLGRVTRFLQRRSNFVELFRGDQPFFCKRPMASRTCCL